MEPFCCDLNGFGVSKQLRWEERNAVCDAGVEQVCSCTPTAKGLAAAVSCITIPVAEKQGILINVTVNWHFFLCTGSISQILSSAVESNKVSFLLWKGLYLLLQSV